MEQTRKDKLELIRRQLIVKTTYTKNLLRLMNMGRGGYRAVKICDKYLNIRPREEV